jgi:predicted TIM-barrel fold metal-dependent hydrolase
LDTLVYSTEILKSLQGIVGSTQLLIGTDFPFPVMDFSAIDDIKQSDTFSCDEKDRIFYKNAVEIFSLPESA